MKRLEGTELKFNLNMAPIGDTHLSDCPFKIYAYTYGTKGYTILKDACIMLDSDNYLVIVDTAKTGPGLIKFKITLDLPDTDFADNYRREVILVETGEEISK